MTTYTDLEIKCLLNAIDDYGRRTPAENAAKGDDLQNILQEMAYVMALLGEPQAADRLRDLALDVGTDFFTIQKEFDELKEELDKFLSEEFDCSSMEEVRKLSWLKVPEEVSTSDAEDILQALAGMPNLHVYDALEALRAAADKNG